VGGLELSAKEGQDPGSRRHGVLRLGKSKKPSGGRGATDYGPQGLLLEVEGSNSTDGRTSEKYLRG